MNDVLSFLQLIADFFLTRLPDILDASINRYDLVAEPANNATTFAGCNHYRLVMNFYRMYLGNSFAFVLERSLDDFSQGSLVSTFQSVL